MTVTSVTVWMGKSNIINWQKAFKWISKLKIYRWKFPGPGPLEKSTKTERFPTALEAVKKPPQKKIPWKKNRWPLVGWKSWMEKWVLEISKISNHPLVTHFSTNWWVDQAKLMANLGFAWPFGGWIFFVEKILLPKWCWKNGWFNSYG